MEISLEALNYAYTSTLRLAGVYNLRLAVVFTSSVQSYYRDRTIGYGVYSVQEAHRGYKEYARLMKYCPEGLSGLAGVYQLVLHEFTHALVERGSTNHYHGDKFIKVYQELQERFPYGKRIK
jgi:hypothetical protein